jgi:hypothetical protein
MYCPNCGANAFPEQKFCRSCGLSLERFSQLLAELLPATEDETTARLQHRLRQLEQLGKLAGIAVGTMAILFLLVFFGGAGIKAIEHDNAGEGFLLLGTLVGCVVAGGFGAYSTFLRRKTQASSSPQLTLPSGEITRKLPPEPQAPIRGNGTEQTTAPLAEKLEKHF